jgi:hypothetical protein
LAKAKDEVLTPPVAHNYVDLIKKLGPRERAYYTLIVGKTQLILLGVSAIGVGSHASQCSGYLSTAHGSVKHA